MSVGHDVKIEQPELEFARTVRPRILSDRRRPANPRPNFRPSHLHYPGRHHLYGEISHRAHRPYACAGIQPSRPWYESERALGMLAVSFIAICLLAIITISFQWMTDEVVGFGDTSDQIGAIASISHT